jgi:hypothetical protein
MEVRAGVTGQDLFLGGGVSFNVAPLCEMERHHGSCFLHEDEYSIMNWCNRACPHWYLTPEVCCCRRYASYKCALHAAELQLHHISRLRLVERAMGAWLAWHKEKQGMQQVWARVEKPFHRPKR